MRRTQFKRKATFRRKKRATGRFDANKGIVGTDLEAKLDKIFSKYIRMKYAKDGMVRCITCGKYDDWSRMDAGHYVSRQYTSVRYDERNVHPQCISCNRFHEGMKDEYTLFLVRTYGPDILEILNKDKWKPVYGFPYEELISKYTKLLEGVV